MSVGYMNICTLSCQEEKMGLACTLLTAVLGASREHRFYWMLSITKPAMPAAEKQNCRNSPQQKQQQQQHTLNTVRP